MDLFVYGTLTFPQVLTAVLGRVPVREPAVAPGWRVAALPGRTYPGLVPAPHAVASGMVISGLTAAESELLDAYETSEYRLTVIQLAGGRRCSSYVWCAEALAEDWDPRAFAAQHLAGYVARHRGPPDR